MIAIPARTLAAVALARLARRDVGTPVYTQGVLVEKEHIVAMNRYVLTMARLDTGLGDDPSFILLLPDAAVAAISRRQAATVTIDGSILTVRAADGTALSSHEAKRYDAWFPDWRKLVLRDDPKEILPTVIFTRKSLELVVATSKALYPDTSNRSLRDAAISITPGTNVDDSCIIRYGASADVISLVMTVSRWGVPLKLA